MPGLSSAFGQSQEAPVRYTTFDGYQFEGLSWTHPGIEPKAVLLVIHGISGAASDFRPVGEFLPALGYPVVGYNLRGLGSDPNQKRRGHVKTLTPWFMDMNSMLRSVRSQYPDTPVYILGESMGSLITIHWFAWEGRQQIQDIRGVILSSPVVELQGDLPWWQDWLARFILLVAPGKKLDFEDFGEKDPDAPSKVTRDSEYAAEQDIAPHKLSTYSLRFLKLIFDMSQGSFEAAQQIQRPTLVLYAENDVFVSPESVAAFVDSLPLPLTTSRLFPEAYHLLFHDPDTPKVLETIYKWLENNGIRALP